MIPKSTVPLMARIQHINVTQNRKFYTGAVSSGMPMWIGLIFLSWFDVEY